MTDSMAESPQSEETRNVGPRWGVYLAWAFVISLLALVGVGLNRTQQGGITRGEAAPEFTLESFEGQEFTLAKMRGEVVLINFWASWCVPCEDEAEALEEAWQYFQERGDVVFLGIDYSDTESKALAFLQRFGVTYPNAPDLGTRVSQAYGITGVPETFIIDRNGDISFVMVGPFQSADQIIANIEPLLE
jgi:cytochrome c biogenesis protein CcmG/thiol:disulfide interchange protein DsbE